MKVYELMGRTAWGPGEISGELIRIGLFSSNEKAIDEIKKIKSDHEWQMSWTDFSIHEWDVSE